MPPAPDLRTRSTARLALTAMGPDDAEQLFAVLSDPRGWWFDPAARHVDLARTRAYTDRAAARWPADGLSYWTARDLRTGDVVGLGGAQRHRSGAWNLSYRVATGQWGRGLATELAAAGVEAARLADPTSPVVAYVLAVNTASARVAAAVGLVDRGPRVDANDGVERHAWSDRPLEPEPG